MSRREGLQGPMRVVLDSNIPVSFLRSGGFRARLDLFADRGFELIARYFEIVVDLHSQPELGRVAKITAEAQGSLSRDAARAVDNRSDAVRRHVKRLRKLVHREAKIGHDRRLLAVILHANPLATAGKGRKI